MNAVRCLLPVLLWGAVLPGLAGTPVRAAETVLADVRLAELAAALTHAPAYMQADFAWSAVYEMALAYAEEAEQARRAAARRRGLERWTHGAESYARHLAAIADSLDLNSLAQVTVGPGDLVYLQLDDETLEVSGPRISAPAAFERRILARFCALQPCDDLLALQQAVPQGPRPKPQPRRPPPQLEVRWSFDAHSGPVCSVGESLVLYFHDGKGLERKRRLCSSIARELYALADALEAVASRGTRIDPDGFGLYTGADGGPGWVSVDIGGDAMSLALPTLAANPLLLEYARHWLAERAVGGTPQLVIRDPERLVGDAGL